ERGWRRTLTDGASRCCLTVCYSGGGWIGKSVFFFSSRRRHTRWPRDWSSDVCSSDLLKPFRLGQLDLFDEGVEMADQAQHDPPRSEERRVGKECRARGLPDHEKKEELHVSERQAEQLVQNRVVIS